MEELESHLNQRADVIGVVLVLGEVTRYYSCQGTRYKYLGERTARIQKAQRKGGSSANRIARLREETIDHYFTLIREDLIRFYVNPHNLSSVRMLLVAGNAEKKNVIASTLPEALTKIPSTALSIEIDRDHDLKSKTDFSVVKRVLCLGQGFISSVDQNQESNVMLYINQKIQCSPDVLVFGIEEVQTALQNGALKTVWMSTPLITNEVTELANSFHTSLVPIQGTFASSHSFVQQYGCVGETWFKVQEPRDSTEE